MSEEGTSDLFESVLQAAGCEEYISDFRKHGIDINVLPILTENDLIAIGIDNENTRKNLLAKSLNLQIPKEATVDIYVDGTYAVQVINNMTSHLHLLNNYFVYAMAREDVIIGNIKLKPATQCLLHCTTLLGKHVETLNQKHNGLKTMQMKSQRNLFLLTSLLLSSTMACYVFMRAFS